MFCDKLSLWADPSSALSCRTPAEHLSETSWLYWLSRVEIWTSSFKTKIEKVNFHLGLETEERWKKKVTSVVCLSVAEARGSSG